jgi:hypothetical protein
MSVFKSFITSDVIVSPFEVNKSFTFRGNELTASNVEIDRYIGRNVTAPLWVSGFYNYLPSTLLANRYFPTGSDDIIGVISIPSNLWGDYLKPGSVILSSGSVILQDDGEGNIIYNSVKYGDVIYEHGIIVIANGGSDAVSLINSLITGSNITCSFSQYKCTLRENEFNFSQNPTLISGSSNSGVLYDFATGSYFSPYVTTVGLYDNNYNLLAVAKLAQPLPTSAVTDTSILVNLDL